MYMALLRFVFELSKLLIHTTYISYTSTGRENKTYNDCVCGDTRRSQWSRQTLRGGRERGGERERGEGGGEPVQCSADQRVLGRRGRRNHGIETWEYFLVEYFSRSLVEKKFEY